MAGNLVIIDSGVSNLASVLAAFQRLGVPVQASVDPAVIRAADRVVLPGVGTAAAAMLRLQAQGLDMVIRSLTQPFLGICLGMQLLFEHSGEGQVGCLGVIPGAVQPLAHQPNMPIPHMGWNQIHPVGEAAHPLLKGVADESFVYFVHSYAAPVGDYTIASCDYTQPFSAMVGWNNFYGCQFHPERSGVVGQRILQNFLELA
jgi:glutamine amidotransferase